MNISRNESVMTSASSSFQSDAQVSDSGGDAPVHPAISVDLDSSPTPPHIHTANVGLSASPSSPSPLVLEEEIIASPPSGHASLDQNNNGVSYRQDPPPSPALDLPELEYRCSATPNHRSPDPDRFDSSPSAATPSTDGSGLVASARSGEAFRFPLRVLFSASSADAGGRGGEGRLQCDRGGSSTPSSRGAGALAGGASGGYGWSPSAATNGTPCDTPLSEALNGAVRIPPPDGVDDPLHHGADSFAGLRHSVTPSSDLDPDFGLSEEGGGDTQYEARYETQHEAEDTTQECRPGPCPDLDLDEDLDLKWESEHGPGMLPSEKPLSIANSLSQSTPAADNTPASPTILSPDRTASPPLSSQDSHFLPLDPTAPPPLLSPDPTASCAGSLNSTEEAGSEAHIALLTVEPSPEINLFSVEPWGCQEDRHSVATPGALSTYGMSGAGAGSARYFLSYLLDACQLSHRIWIFTLM